MPARRKFRLLGRALVAGAWAVPGLSAPPLPEAGFLVATSATPTLARPRSLWGRLDDRIAWAVELFERLERLDLAKAARSGAAEPARAALSGGSPGG